VYIWGKATDGMMGFAPLPAESIAATDSGKGSMLLVPTKMPNLHRVTCISGNTRQTLAVDADGAAYSWGQNDLYETGHGGNISTVEVATLIKNKEIEGKKFILAGAGAGWGFLAAEAAAKAPSN